MDTNQKAQAAEGSPPAGRRPVNRFGLRVLTTLLVIAALGASAWVYYDSRVRLNTAQQDLARRLSGFEQEAREARAAAVAAQEATRDLQAKLGALEGRVSDTQSQQAALESLYQELSRNRDEWQLAEIEQVLAIAQQQLQLSGNVRAALLALRLAESRLSRADRPQFLPVRRALARDIGRLKALPAADLAGMSRRLDALLAAVDDLPLAYDGRLARGAAEAPAPAPAGALARFGAGLWRDLKALVVVRRVDAPEPPLLPPEQAYFLRENLRLRLLNARLDLQSRNQAAFEEDLRVAQRWLRRYYDEQAATVQGALSQLREMQAAPISIEPLSISDSLDAVRAFKARRERSSG